MPDYKEGAIAGIKWTRCCMMVIDNTYNQIPSVQFVEEERMVIDGQGYCQSKGSILAQFSDPTATVVLLDPATDQPTGGTITHGEIYAILRSLYLGKAVERDELLANPPAEEPEVLV